MPTQDLSGVANRGCIWSGGILKRLVDEQAYLSVL
jgi:hypothetical protein